MRLVLLPLLLALPVTVLAQDCGADSQQRITQAYQQRSAGTLPERAGWTIAADQGVCRVWPADTSLTLMAVPVLGQEQDGGAWQEGDLDVLVVDTATLRPRASLRLSGMMGSDAIRAEGVSLDTARYRLSNEVRAFGVRTSRSGSSRPNPFNDTRLQLFALNGDTLEMLTAPMVVAQLNGEWDTNCAGEFSELNRTLDVGPIPAQGFAELRVRERSHSNRNHEDAAGTCVDKRAEQPGRSYILRPQGRHYPLPEALQATF